MMTHTIHIVVLLSSFNGEAYIEEQIRSILNQRDVTVSLTVRDDGSTDKTREILNRLASENPNLFLSFGENIGVVRSFFTLMKNAQGEVSRVQNYFALSDQDDVWHPEKLFNAVTELQKKSNDEILMYCSAIEYVDSALNHLGNSQMYSKDKIGFGNALVQNIAAGCTVVLNKAALSKIVFRLPERCVMHDWWIYLVVSAFGEVIYDPRIGMQYRQHTHNVVGVASSPLNKYKRRWRRLFSDFSSIKPSEQLTEFKKIFGNELSEKKQKKLNHLVAYKKNSMSRLLIIFSQDFYRQTALDNVLIKLSMLIGRF